MSNNDINLNEMTKAELRAYAKDEFDLTFNSRATKSQIMEEIYDFGWEDKTEKKKEKPLQSVVAPRDDDGAGYITAAGGHFGSYIDLEGDKVKDDRQMIMKYRQTATHPEVDAAIDDIVNEAISGEDEVVQLDLDALDASEPIKKKIQEEFEGIVNMLDFKRNGHDMFRRWYIDGRLFHHLVVDSKNINKGIQEIRPIDATRISKKKIVTKDKVPGKNAEVITKIEEVFIFEEEKEKGITITGSSTAGGGNAVKMAPESISYVTSGLLDPTGKKVISYLQQAIIPANQLRMMEQALLIYRISRAPERRIFKIDVSGMTPKKADSYLSQIMARYRNKMVYNAETGTIDNQNKHMSMLDDFWVPQREGRGTDVDTLPGGDQLGQIEDVLLFRKNLYRTLHVPVGRLDPEQAAAVFGSPSEITRDEFKFQKFIEKLRMRFQALFVDILRKQLVLKKIVTDEDWEKWHTDIVVDFISNNYFTELKNAEMLRGRVAMLRDIEDYVGKYFSMEWVQKNVLMLSDDDIKTMTKQIDDETKSGKIQKPEDGDEF